MNTWTVHTDVFDGPLDLLLYLVKRDGIDLRQLRVSEVAASYLTFLDQMHDLNLAVASEYLVMAATLVHLKSLEMLPRPPHLVEEEDEPDPREVLLQQLEAYAAYKQAAEELAARPQLGRDVFTRVAEEAPAAERPLVAGVDAFGLLEVYHQLITRAAQPAPTFTIGDEGPGVETCCRFVLRALGCVGGCVELGQLLQRLGSRLERVATFVAVLEMTRLRWLDLSQQEHLGPVLLTARVSPEIDLSAVTGWVIEEAS